VVGDAGASLALANSRRAAVRARPAKDMPAAAQNDECRGGIAVGHALIMANGAKRRAPMDPARLRLTPRHSGLTRNGSGTRCSRAPLRVENAISRTILDHGHLADPYLAVVKLNLDSVRRDHCALVSFV
jgi:hypothetical protein